MNYSLNQFENTFSQSNNFYFQLSPCLRQEFNDLANKAQNFLNHPTLPNSNTGKFTEQVINFCKKLPPHLQQQLPPALRYIANLPQQQTAQFSSSPQHQPVINPLNEKIIQLIKTLTQMLVVSETNLAFNHRQISNVIKFLNDVKNNPNNNETNYIFDIIGRLSSNNPEENAINLLIIILDDFPEIINEQDKTIPQLENPNKQLNLS